MISCRDGRLNLALGSLFMAIVLFGASPSIAAAPAPAGRVIIAWHVTISPSWFDPSTAPPQITPFGMLYAIHDALVRPYPGQKMGPSLAESWEESEDGLTYQFKLRPGLQFHNSDPLTTEDVKFSFERYQGAGAQTLKDHVREIEIVDPQIVRFHLKAPWPDFMTFYGTTATAAGIVVPKKYLTEIGDDGFKKHPVGAGPYIRRQQARHRGRIGGLSGLLAARAEHQDRGHAQRPRCNDAGVDGQDRRSGHGLRARRRRR